MKNWLKQIRDGIGREKEDKKENIASLYEIIEDFLKALDHEQVKGIREEFLERYEVHRDIIGEVIKPSLKKRETTESPGEKTVLRSDSEKVNVIQEISEIRFRAIEEKIDSQSRTLEENLKLRIDGIEKGISETSAYHLDLIKLLQQGVHEQNRRIFFFFNRVWLLILGLVISILIGGAALIVVLLK